jgi:hypothetical protein
MWIGERRLNLTYSKLICLVNKHWSPIFVFNVELIYIHKNQHIDVILENVLQHKKTFLCAASQEPSPMSQFVVKFYGLISFLICIWIDFSLQTAQAYNRTDDNPLFKCFCVPRSCSHQAFCKSLSFGD